MCTWSIILLHRKLEWPLIHNIQKSVWSWSNFERDSCVPSYNMLIIKLSLEQLYMSDLNELLAQSSLCLWKNSRHYQYNWLSPGWRKLSHDGPGLVRGKFSLKLFFTKRGQEESFILSPIGFVILNFGLFNQSLIFIILIEHFICVECSRKT